MVPFMVGWCADCDPLLAGHVRRTHGDMCPKCLFIGNKTRRPIGLTLHFKWISGFIDSTQMSRGMDGTHPHMQTHQKIPSSCGGGAQGTGHILNAKLVILFNPKSGQRWMTIFTCVTIEVISSEERAGVQLSYYVKKFSGDVLNPIGLIKDVVFSCLDVTWVLSPRAASPKRIWGRWDNILIDS